MQSLPPPPVDGARQTFQSVPSSISVHNFEPLTYAHNSTINSMNPADQDCLSFLYDLSATVLSYILAPFVFVFDFIWANFFAEEAGLLNLGNPRAGTINDPSRGPVDPKTGVSFAAIAETKNYEIAKDRLAHRPEPLLAEELQREGVNQIDVGELVAFFDRTIADSGSDVPAGEAAHARRYIQHYVDFIQRRSGPSDMYNNNLKLTAQNFILEMRKPYLEVPLHKRRAAFFELADAAEHCRPRMYEEMQRQYKMVTNQQLTIEQKLLMWLQMLKEDILIQKFQGTQFHVINRARNEVGGEWGLDANEISQNDEHIGCGGSTSKEEYVKVLTKNYTPGRMVDAIHSRLIYDGNNELINQYMQHHLTDGTDPTSLFESNGTTINHKGVAWLLIQHGFLEQTVFDA